ncbi:MAG: LON peptidase substrate-binding domain-containing protein [candidate division KSB1 bacterium]|nr:LON peptidase substrate-binding domain-containing protein [candidate division KSB1 bacterium]MDZ7272738.1 LON peptidase substrate-binding domain-containing protein [candidate division KSB1 bacterium]MDZ7284237.1 LON peptidase substrate-binding domain-containing protein [candidate division KSB1 bacterium]MDZ7297364.1 LON peptidase substrate-binding domain-containing protein [candidate division KSB1 bacterium]MDZ7309062.1 LON peptidase substrate-binding domain-containing protein [candidate div
MATIVLPIFPLPNVVFFPKILLPLHIFEPRYKQMVNDALEHERQIGMILLKDGGGRDSAGLPAVYRIGCMGRIEAYERLPEGRFNILLHGLRRFELVRFVKDKPYRIAVVNLLDDTPSARETHEQLRARDHLLERFFTYFNQVLGIDLDDNRWDRSASLEMVVNQVAAILDIPVSDKQQLLEMPAVEKRLDVVQGIVDGRLNYAAKLRQVVASMRVVPEDPELN